MTPEELTYNLAATASLFEPVLTQVNIHINVYNRDKVYNYN